MSVEASTFDHIYGFDANPYNPSPDLVDALARSGYDAQNGPEGHLTLSHLAANVTPNPELAAKIRAEAIAEANENADEEDETEPEATIYSPFAVLSTTVKNALGQAYEHASSQGRPTSAIDVWRIILVKEVTARHTKADTMVRFAPVLHQNPHIWERNDHVMGIVEAVGEDPLDLLVQLDKKIPPVKQAVLTESADSAARRDLITSRR